MSDPADRLRLALADHYRIERELGRGGMATVYLAHDLKHDRDVAIKLLHPDLAATLGGERFLSEIKTTARLQHPHILPLLDSGAADGLLYYVMPFVNGETLRSRLDREKQLPIGDAMHIAGEVADALSAAHALGIIHRDIKPENILLQGGHALVADFGIALAVHHAGTARLTQSGMSLGTPQYMSPEQAMGERAIDARSDIYSLGCVLYEMLAGEPPYTGPTAQAILARKATMPLPPLRVVRETVSAAVEAVVERALAKAPADRFATAAELGEAIEGASRPRSDDRTSWPSARRGSRLSGRQWAAIATAGAALAAVVAVLVVMRTGRHQVPATALPARLEYSQLTNFPGSATSPALSPDGHRLAFIVGESTYFGPGQIWVKELPNGESVQLTHDSLHKMGPAFSPDGSRITYSTWSSAGYDTWVVPVLGGQPRLFLTNAQALTWIDSAAAEPRVLFSELGNGALALVTSATNRAQSRVVYRPPPPGMAHRSRLSPDHAWGLVVEMGLQSWLPCRLVRFADGAPERLVGPNPAQCTDAAWSPDGRWMYFSANAGNGFHLWRQRFPDGLPQQLTSGATEEEGLALAPDGRSVLTSIGSRQSTVWIHDARGERQITSEGYGMSPTFSPDGRKLYFLLREGGARSFVSGALWVADLATGERRRLLSGFLMQAYAVSRDGERVAFVAANDTAGAPLWVAATDERSAPRRIVPDDVMQHRVLFDGDRNVIFARHDAMTISLFRIHEDDGVPHELGPGVLLESVSADGRWIARWDLGLVDRIVVSPVAGGKSTVICTECVPPSFERMPWPPAINWTPDGRFVYLSLYGTSYAVPLNPGDVLPPIPPGGLSSDREVAALPGARRIAPQQVYPGPDPSRWAFTKVTIERNIYRVPLP